MAYSVFGATLSAMDIVGLTLFFLLTIVYHVGYSLYSRSHPLNTVKGKIHLYRRTWVKRILDRKDFILAVQTVRNLMMSANFLATASLLAIGLIFNMIVSLAQTESVAAASGTSGGGLIATLHITRPDLLPFQLYFLAAIFAFAFWEFLLAIRYLNQLTVLIGADPDLIDQIEGMDAVTYLTTLLNRATNRYTYGQRGFYFSTAVFAWIYSPIAFIIVTGIMGLFFIGVLDFQRWRPPKAVKKAEIVQP